MTQSVEESVRQTFAEDDPGLVTEAKVLAAVQRIVEFVLGRLG